jgi:hypothetical protein
MDRLDIVQMIVSPSPSHPFGLDVVGHNLVAIREGSGWQRAEQFSRVASNKQK